MHYIMSEMDEIEREEFFRIKRTQQKKMIRAQKHAEANRIKEDILRGDTVPPVETVDEILDEVDKIVEGDEAIAQDQAEIESIASNAEANRLKEEILRGDTVPPVETVDEILDEVDKIAEGDETIAQDQAEIESIASKETPPPAAAGEQYKYSVESPKESKTLIAKTCAHQDLDSNKHCELSCSETLEALKRKISVLMNKMNNITTSEDVIDESIPREIPTEVPEKKQRSVDSATQVNNDFPEGLCSGGPNIKTEETSNTDMAKTEKKMVKPSESSQKQSVNDEISSLPSFNKISKSDSPLSGSSLGYVKKIFKETVKIRRLPNRFGQICEEKEVIIVKSEIKKYKPTDENVKERKGRYIDDMSIISGESTEAGPSNKTQYCRLCEKDSNEKNTSSEGQDKCTGNCNEKIYSDESDTSHTKENFETVNHLTLPRHSPTLENNSDINSVPIIEEYDNILKAFSFPLWNDWNESKSVKLPNNTNTKDTEAMPKTDDTQNLCNISSISNDTESKCEGDDISKVTKVFSDVIYSTKPSEIENNLKNNADVDQEIPYTSNKSPTEKTNTEYSNNNAEVQEIQNIECIIELNNSECDIKQQLFAEKNKSADITTNDNEHETSKTCNIATDSSANEITHIEPNNVRDTVKFANEIDTKRLCDKRVEIILTDNIVSNDNSSIFIDCSDNSCIPSTTAQANDLENFEQTSAVLNPVGSTISSQNNKISSDNRSITESCKQYSNDCLACGYRQYQSSQGTDILSLVYKEPILEGKKTKSEYCNTDFRDVNTQASSDGGSLHKNSFTNCRSVVNTFKGYLAKIRPQTKTVSRNNFRDCIYYQMYDSKEKKVEEDGQKDVNEEEMSVVDVKVNCPMCEKDDKEDSNGMIKKLFENIQQTLKRSFVTKNNYSQTSLTNFKLSIRSSSISRRPSNSSNKLAECNAKMLLKYMFDDDDDDGRIKFENNYESQKYYVCSHNNTKQIAPHCPLCAADVDGNASISTIPADSNNYNHTDIEVIEFDTKSQCADCLEERNANYANYNEEGMQPRRFTKPKFKVYHQYMVHVDNSVPKCLASKCSANCNVSFCSNFLDDVDSRLVNVIDMGPSVRTNADILKHTVLTGIMEAEKKVEIYANTIKSVKNKLVDIQSRFIDAEKYDNNLSSRADTTKNNDSMKGLSKDSKYESETGIKKQTFRNVVDSLTSVLWKTRHKNEYSYNDGNEVVCHACNRPLDTKIDNYKVVHDAYVQTNITLSCPLQGKCTSKCKSINSSNRIAKYNLDDSQIKNEQRSQCYKLINIPNMQKLANDKGRQENSTRKIGKGNCERSCKVCKEANQIYNPVQNDEVIDNSLKDNVLEETILQTCSNVPVDVLLEKAKTMEPAIIKAIKKVVKCGNKQCINKLSSVLEAIDNSQLEETIPQTCSNVPVDVLLEKAKTMEPAIIKAIKKVVKCGNKHCINKLASVLHCENNRLATAVDNIKQEQMNSYTCPLNKYMFE